jgi:phosphatidylglycerophosphate synthase
MVNKIPKELDNPIDIMICDHIEKYLDLYKNIGLTPNLLTTISLISGLTSVYLVHKDQYIIGALLWFIAYYYDCADGKMARRFNMTSKFGDLYDHASDIFKHALMFYVLYKKIDCKSNTIRYLIIGSLIIICFLTVCQLGCQERLARENKVDKKTESPTLALTEQFIFTDCKKQMQFTRFFGPATITLYLMKVMIYLHFSEIVLLPWSTV